MKYIQKIFNEYLCFLQKKEDPSKDIQELISISIIAPRFIVLCIISSIICSIGVFMNNSIIVIASMIIAPLLQPIMMFCAGIFLLKYRLIFCAFKSIFVSFGTVIITSAIFTYISVVLNIGQDTTPFIDSFFSFGVLYYIMAFISGFVGIYVWFSSEKSSQLVGVSVAVSLIPVLTVIGIYVGSKNWQGVIDMISVFGINIVLIILGAIIAFFALRMDKISNILRMKIKDSLN